MTLSLSIIDSTNVKINCKQDFKRINNFEKSEQNWNVCVNEALDLVVTVNYLLWNWFPKKTWDSLGLRISLTRGYIVVCVCGLISGKNVLILNFILIIYIKT